MSNSIVMYENISSMDGVREFLTPAGWIRAIEDGHRNVLSIWHAPNGPAEGFRFAHNLAGSFSLSEREIFEDSYRIMTEGG
jgi:hypothetical protein